MKPESQSCPHCGGKTGYEFEQIVKFSQQWGESEKKVMFYMTSVFEVRCLDCQKVMSVKKPDSAVKKADSL